ncbi:Replication initiation factor [Candidatus Izimaplasma bacterium HR1]|uniref:replication initiation factor domain-containing protein n=1 Tax=Candidatus Izimoplasma sp. HR1 TaxID=1541959 RepID=UPI0004F6807C|nr:Replication initiation factor [Candidatus Izimaplasma bacterium HR1]
MKTPEVNVLFDYLTITFPIDEDESIYISKFGNSWKSLYQNKFFRFFMSLVDVDITKFTDEGKIGHYERLLKFEEHIDFKYSGPTNVNDIRTHALELKGEGCREVELLGIDWYELLEYVYTNNLNISTWHLACDIFTPKYFTIDQLLKKAKSKEYVSSVNSCWWIEGHKNGSYTGTTIYHGRRDGEQICTYDKQYERYYRGYEVDTNFWLRIEIRLKRKTMDLLKLIVAHGIEELPKIYFSVLRGMLEFKTKGTSNQITRWKTWRPWERFVQGNEKIRLYNQAKLETDITRTKDWYVKSAGKARVLIRATSTDLEFEELHESIISEKLEKIKNSDLTMVNKERMKKGLDIFDSLEDLKDYIVFNGLV